MVSGVEWIMDWMDGDSHGTELNLDSTGRGKASRFPEVKSGGHAAGFLEFGWIHRWIGS